MSPRREHGSCGLTYAAAADATYSVVHPADCFDDQRAEFFLPRSSAARARNQSVKTSNQPQLQTVDRTDVILHPVEFLP